ncbi:TPA: hypothetical protein ACH7B7_005177 [Escherichia coli]
MERTIQMVNYRLISLALTDVNATMFDRLISLALTVKQYLSAR